MALLIANSNYPDAEIPLPEVAAGADLLANALRSHGFVVDVVRDATRAGITARSCWFILADSESSREAKTT